MHRFELTSGEPRAGRRSDRSSKIPARQPLHAILSESLNQTSIMLGKLRKYSGSGGYLTVRETSWKTPGGSIL